jgi:hypothetical protein
VSWTSASSMSVLVRCTENVASRDANSDSQFIRTPAYGKPEIGKASSHLNIFNVPSIPGDSVD